MNKGLEAKQEKCQGNTKLVRITPPYTLGPK